MVNFCVAAAASLSLRALIFHYHTYPFDHLIAVSGAGKSPTRGTCDSGCAKWFFSGFSRLARIILAEIILKGTFGYIFLINKDTRMTVLYFLVNDQDKEKQKRL